MTKILIQCDQEDWHDVCKIMRSITWGHHDISDTWYKMKDRIEKRLLIKTEEKQEINISIDPILGEFKN